MSETGWYCALADSRGLTVWPMRRSGAGDPAFHPRAALATLPGPLVVAGLDVAPRPVPCAPLDKTRHAPDAPLVAAIPMLAQKSPAALTRGSETALAGYIAAHPDFDGILLAIGPEETCWAHISAREVVSFAAFLTPALCTALTVPAPALDAQFDAALSETLSRPDRLAQHLAGAGAGATGQQAAHLVGAEIAAAKPYWLGQDVVIIGDGARGDAHARALTAQGSVPRRADFTAHFIAGCSLAWNDLSRSPG